MIFISGSDPEPTPFDAPPFHDGVKDGSDQERTIDRRNQSIICIVISLIIEYSIINGNINSCQNALTFSSAYSTRRRQKW